MKFGQFSNSSTSCPIITISIPDAPRSGAICMFLQLLGNLLMRLKTVQMSLILFGTFFSEKSQAYLAQAHLELSDWKTVRKSAGIFWAALYKAFDSMRLVLEGIGPLFGVVYNASGNLDFCLIRLGLNPNGCHP